MLQALLLFCHISRGRMSTPCKQCLHSSPQVAQLLSLPSQPDVVSKLVGDLMAIQLAGEPAAPYLMALIQVSTWGTKVR